MSSLEKIIRSRRAGPSVAFRERAYGSIERQGLIRDILGLANALVDGPRYLIMGVRDGGPDDRSFVGISDEELDDAYELYQTQLTRYIEPVLKIDLETMELGGVPVAILALNDCAEPPYLLKKNVSNTMREGSGWIRRAAQPRRMRRTDLQQLFEKTALSKAYHPTIQIGFTGEGHEEEITLAVLDLSELPSAVAGEKFRKLMDAKQASQGVGGKSETRLERLVHAREFGGTQPYHRSSETSLMRRLDSTEEEYHWADDYYAYETRTHQLNFNLANIGEVGLRDGRLTLDFPRVDGLGISDYIRIAPDSEDDESPKGYPKIETGEHRIRVQAKIQSVPRHSTVPAFRQPLRVWVREPVAGRTLPVDYSLHSASLREPVVGTLRIHVSPAQAGS